VTTEPGTEAKVDGRRLRAEKTRVAIVDGLLALIEDGDLKPTAPQIADRAHVSLRTVFQHFAEVEALFAAVSERQVERIAGMVSDIDTRLPLPERLDAFVGQRCRLLEFVTPIARAAQLQEPTSPMVQVEAERLRRLARDEVERVFAAELAALEGERRDLLLSSLNAAVTWRAWETLRAEEGLDQPEAEACIRFSAGAILAAAGFDPS
jgi:AcrR family transcriptional regulator